VHRGCSEFIVSLCSELDMLLVSENVMTSNAMF